MFTSSPPKQQTKPKPMNKKTIMAELKMLRKLQAKSVRDLIRIAELERILAGK